MALVKGDPILASDYNSALQGKEDFESDITSIEGQSFTTWPPSAVFPTSWSLETHLPGGSDKVFIKDNLGVTVFEFTYIDRGEPAPPYDRVDVDVSLYDFQKVADRANPNVIDGVQVELPGGTYTIEKTGINSYYYKRNYGLVEQGWKIRVLNEARTDFLPEGGTVVTLELAQQGLLGASPL